MKILTATLASLILLASPSLFASKVYRVIDADGQVTFTDSPAANTKAENVDLPKTNIATAPPAHTTEADSEATGDEVPYTSARIAKPLNKATIPPGQTSLMVELALKPALQEGHLVRLYVDGRPQGAASASTTFSLAGLNRGEHKVHMEVLGADKKRRTKTGSVTFYVKQHSAKH